MYKKLVSKSEFARMAGVSAAAVTKACNNALYPAVEGKRIDISHPLAAEYLDSKVSPESFDDLYNEVSDWCEENNIYSVSLICEHFKIGLSKARKIAEAMKDNGLMPDSPRTQRQKKPVIEPEVITENQKPHTRGMVAAKEKHKLHAPPETREGTIDIPDDIGVFLDMSLRDLIDKFGTDTRFVDWLSATQKIESINEKRLKNAATQGLLISRDLVKVGVIDTFNSAHLRLMKDGAKSITAGVIAKHASGASLVEVEAYVSDILGSFIKPVKAKIARALKNA